MGLARGAPGSALLVMTALPGCLTTIDLGLLDGSMDAGVPAAERCDTDAGTAACVQDGSLYCPEEMVRVPSTPTFCIDRTEVTNAAYRIFLEATAPPGTSGQPSFCRWNDDYTPSKWPFTTGEENRPVVGVDWCDALAFCARAKKRLCGRIGGGACPVGEVATASISQWYAACSALGARAYPYGSTYDPAACNGDRRVGAPDAVGSFPLCSGGYAGIVDMSGNVEEWIDACSPGQGASGVNDECLSMGGSVSGTPDRLDCEMSATSDRRSRGQAARGFRCCSP